MQLYITSLIPKVKQTRKLILGSFWLIMGPFWISCLLWGKGITRDISTTFSAFINAFLPYKQSWKVGEQTLVGMWNKLKCFQKRVHSIIGSFTLYAQLSTNSYIGNFVPSKHVVIFIAGLWSRKSRHPTPTPGNFDYPTPTPTPDRLQPSAVLVT